MAQSQALLKRSLLTTIFGGRLGLAQPQGPYGAEVVAGPADIQKQITDIQSTVPNTAVDPFGYVRVLTSGSSQGPTQHQLKAPIPGVEVTLMLNSTSTGSQQFGSTANGASIFISSLGTTGGWVNFVGPGGSITLVGLSTAVWGVKSEGLYASTALAKAVTFTTST